MDGVWTTQLAREVTAAAVSELDRLIRVIDMPTREPGPGPTRVTRLAANVALTAVWLVGPIHRQLALGPFASLPSARRPSAWALVLAQISTPYLLPRAPVALLACCPAVLLSCPRLAKTPSIQPTKKLRPLWTPLRTCDLGHLAARLPPRIHHLPLANTNHPRPVHATQPNRSACCQHRGEEASVS
jgi:hypothetical protein